MDSSQPEWYLLNKFYTLRYLTVHCSKFKNVEDIYGTDFLSRFSLAPEYRQPEQHGPVMSLLAIIPITMVPSNSWRFLHDDCQRVRPKHTTLICYIMHVLHARTNQLAEIKMSKRVVESREEFSSARSERAGARTRPRGLATFTFTCNYLPLRACLRGSIIARGSESSRLVSSPWDGQRRPADGSRSRLAGGRRIFQFYFVSRSRLFSREIEAFTRDRCFIPAQYERLGNFVWRNASARYIPIYTCIK